MASRLSNLAYELDCRQSGVPARDKERNAAPPGESNAAMKRFTRWLLLAMAFTALLAIVEPPVRIAIFTARLVSRPPPILLPLPVDRSHAMAIHDSWQAPRSGGRRHEGIDIFVPEGTPVRSTTTGLVARVGSNRLGGNVVWTLGPGGQRHYYAHLQRFAGIHAGQVVAAGEILGYVGRTGNARGTPPHLHYGIYVASGPLHP